MANKEMTSAEKQTWRLYRASFKDGEDVVVEDDLGRFHWGKLYTTKEVGIELRRPGSTESIEWENILFMAHDGFPVQRIRGMSEETAAILAEQTSTEAIRAALSLPPIQEDCGREGCIEPASYPSHKPRYCSEACYSKRSFAKTKETLEIHEKPVDLWLGGGCPYLFGPFIVTEAVNVGNVGQKHWGEDTEELFVLTSGDGARCHLSYLSHHFQAEMI